MQKNSDQGRQVMRARANPKVLRLDSITITVQIIRARA
jgi:hypothetical protein